MPITTLPDGLQLKLPSDPTYGDVFYPALEYDIQRINDHTHNGTLGNITPTSTVSVSAGSWGADLGGGTYRQSKAVATGYTMDNSIIQVRNSSGHIVYPTIEKIDANNFYIYTNNNANAYTVHFL